MKMKTESGVSITFISEGSSKIMSFDKPVRAIELKREEMQKIRSLLASNTEMEPVVRTRNISRISQTEE